MQKINRFYARKEPWSDNIELRGFQTVMRETFVFINVEMKHHTQGEVTSPFMSLQPEEGQQLIDELYAVGLRPSQERGSAGQLDAVKFHLEDMRKLVFNKGN
jgi:hypothetical protein